MLRDDDPEVARALAAGWRVTASSWGARLRIRSAADLEPARIALVRGRAAGLVPVEFGAERADAYLALLAATAADFPVTPATPAPSLDRDRLLARFGAGLRGFGVVAGESLLGATVIEVGADGVAETGETSVLAAHRNRGIARAVKAASVLTLADADVTVFGTGGAGANAASIRMNETLGYVREETWLSLDPPA